LSLRRTIIATRLAIACLSLLYLLGATAVFADVASPAASGCAGAVDRQGAAMGTRVHLIVCPKGPDPVDHDAAQEAAQAAFAEFGRLEGLWTTWSPASEVSRINAAAGSGRIRVSSETYDVLAAALAGSRMSNGLFDITFAPLGEVWRFDTPPGSHEPTHLERIPSLAEVRRLRARVGWRHLHLDPAKRQAWLDRRGMAIHLGGIGKGAGVDRAVAILRSKGFADFVVQAGGDLYCAGLNGKRPWHVGIAHPRNKAEILGSMNVTDAAFSTSGDYERYAILNGKRYHHILDPRTGFPGSASQSATVLAASATQAEVLTKTAFLLGGAAGLDLLKAQGVRGLLVDAGGKVWQSADLELTPR